MRRVDGPKEFYVIEASRDKRDFFSVGFSLTVTVGNDSSQEVYELENSTDSDTLLGKADEAGAKRVISAERYNYLEE